MKLPLLIDFFGGPASGKSTTSLNLAGKLKCYLDDYAGSGMRVEYVSEAAKDEVWESGTLMLSNQARLLGEQFRRLHRLSAHVQIIVSDSPLWLCEHYGPKKWYPTPAWAEVIRAHYESFRVLPILVTRTGRFETKGRVHDEVASAEAHEAIADIARREYGPTLLEMRADLRTPFRIIEHLAATGEIPPQRSEQDFFHWYAREVEKYE